MTSVYSTRRFAPGEWEGFTPERRHQVWEQLRSACAEKAAVQGLTATIAHKTVEQQVIRWAGDETGWEERFDVIATDVTVQCDTTKMTASGETRQDVLDKPRDQRES